MNLEQLRAYLAVVRLGTLTRAAEELSLSQSTLSFRIKGLEDSVGSKLLDRGGTEALPTEAGRILLPYAEQMVGMATEAANRIRLLGEEPAGEVRLAASTVPAEYLLPAQLAAFRGTHPSVSFVAQVMDSREATRALLDSLCELAFVGAEGADKKRLQSEPFALDEIVLVGARGDPTPKAMGEQELARQPWIRRGVGSGTRRAVDALLSGEASAAMGETQVSSTEAVRRCVLAGLGVAFVSLSAVKGDIADGSIRIIKFPGTPLKRQFFAQRLRTKTLSPAAEAFWSFVLS